MIEIINDCDMRSLNRINPKEIPVGSVAYFVRKNGNNWTVHYGIVTEHYTSEVCLDLLEIVEYRLVNGIPANEFKTPAEWKKLPKNWTWNTKLIEITYDGKIEKMLRDTEINVHSPESILKAFNAGLLVKARTKPNEKFEEEIDRNKGYRIVRKAAEYRSPYVSLNYHEVYKTFEEAQAVVDSYRAQVEAIAAMSDYDWSVREIDHVLGRWAKLYGTDNEAEKYREWLLSRDRVEDIEVRLFGGEIQWKYFKNKKWMAIEIN